MDMIRAVVFDMDGTLLDSMHVWKDVGKQYLTTLDIQAEDHLQDILAPLSITQSCEYLKTHYHLTQTIEEIREGIHTVVYSHYEQDVQLKPGVKECIQRCLAKGRTLCVLSASSEEMITVALRRCGILDAFSLIMTCEKAGCAKTDPRIYEKTLQTLGVEKNACIFIDDAYYAINCMKQAGYNVIAVYDDANKKEWDEICKITDQQYRTLKEWEE